MGDDLDAADRSPVCGGLAEDALDLFPGQFARRDLLRQQRRQLLFLLRGGGGLDPVCHRVAKFVRQRDVERSGVVARARRHFSREERRGNSVFVGGPHRPVAAQERGTCALFAGKAQRAAVQPFGKPLEAGRHLPKLAPEPGRHPVYQLGADNGLADGRVQAPLRTVLKQVLDGDRQVVVGRQQTGFGRNDAVAVVIGVAGEGDVEMILVEQQSLHGVLRRRVHPDLPIPIQAHEAECRVDCIADDGKVEAVALGDGGPVVHPCATQRVDTDADVGVTDHSHVEHAVEVAHIRVQEIVAVGGGRSKGLGMGNSFDAFEARFEKPIGRGFDPVGDVLAGRATMGRVVLEAAIARRVVRRRHHDAVRQARVTPEVVAQDRVRNRGRRRGLVVCGQHHADAIGRQHFERARARRLRQRMRVDPHEQRPVDALEFAVLADGLRDRQHVLLVERAVERRTAMTRGAERDALRRHRRVGNVGEIRGAELRHVDQRRSRCLSAGQRADAVRHGAHATQPLPSHPRDAVRSSRAAIRSPLACRRNFGHRLGDATESSGPRCARTEVGVCAPPNTARPRPEANES